MERLPRPAAARADDQRGPADAEVFERVRGLERTLLRRERQRGLDAAVLLRQERAAAGAVIGGLLVLEAALLTVDVTHTGGMLSRDGRGARSCVASTRVTRTRSVWLTRSPAGPLSRRGWRSGGRRPPGRARSGPRSSAAA